MKPGTPYFEQGLRDISHVVSLYTRTATSCRGGCRRPMRQTCRGQRYKNRAFTFRSITNL